MAVSSSDHAHGDLLDSETQVRSSRRPPRSALLAAAGAAVILAGALIAQVTRGNESDGLALEDMSGSLTLSNFRSTTVPSPFEGDQERNAHGSGSVHLQLTDRDVDGLADVTFSGSFQPSVGPEEGVPFSAHLWGGISLVFGSNRCRGSFGWSNFTTPPESGGSMHARCEDGATLAATLIATQEFPGEQRLVIDLRDGWYVAGPAKDD
jgi:hypothetical protein